LRAESLSIHYDRYIFIPLSLPLLKCVWNIAKKAPFYDFLRLFTSLYVSLRLFTSFGEDAYSVGLVGGNSSFVNIKKQI
jgi:hypothetical protein